MRRYHTYNPAIPPTQWKTSVQLKKDLSTKTAQITITQPQWDTLIQQIPPEMAKILLDGNQKFFDDEFLATMLRGGTMADIYLLSNDTLTYYTRDPDDDLMINRSHQSGQPGQRVDHSSQNYPRLDDLKRVYISKHNNQIHLVSWALSQYSLPPKKKTEIIQFAGLTAGSYSNKLGNDHTKVSKQWRISNNKRHDHISQFSLNIFNKGD